jgi:hypothetical protein
MPDIIDRLIELPVKDLNIWRGRRRSRGAYKRHLRKKYTKEQLAEYLNKKGFKTRSKLRAGREAGDPTDNDYVEAYGSWGNAIEEIFERFDRRYILKTIIEFNLWTFKDYLSACKGKADIIPPYRMVLNEFGSWSNAKELATAMSIRRTLQAYIHLKKRLGKIPTLKECQMAGIIIDVAVETYGGKSELDSFIKSLEEL